MKRTPLGNTETIRDMPHATIKQTTFHAAKGFKRFLLCRDAPKGLRRPNQNLKCIAIPFWEPSHEEERDLIRLHELLLIMHSVELVSVADGELEAVAQIGHGPLRQRDNARGNAALSCGEGCAEKPNMRQCRAYMWQCRAYASMRQCRAYTNMRQCRAYTKYTTMYETNTNAKRSNMIRQNGNVCMCL